MRLAYLHRRVSHRRRDLPQLPATCSSSASATCATTPTSARRCRRADIVVNAAALKQVPTCEYFPIQAMLTNCIGAYNIVRAIEENGYPVETVVGDQHRQGVQAGQRHGHDQGRCRSASSSPPTSSTRSTRFICVRYGNVLASRGSVIPLFHDQIRRGGPVTITDAEHDALPAEPRPGGGHRVRRAAGKRSRGETYVPRAPSATVMNIAQGADRQAQASPIKIDRHPARREDARDHGVRGGDPSLRAARRLLRDPADAARAARRTDRRAERARRRSSARPTPWSTCADTVALLEAAPPDGRRRRPRRTASCCADRDRG